MDVTAIDSTVSDSSDTSTSNSSSLGKEDFLTLLITQLKNQDPLEPMDSTDMTAQLAQFSSLEQLQLINENLENLQLSQEAISNAQAASFIGKTIVASGNSIQVEGGVSEELYFTLSSAAKAVHFSIYDAEGSFVAALEAGYMDAGEQTFAWDATDANSNTVADGEYTFEIIAYDDNDEIVDATALITDRVTGVTYQDGVAYLIAGNQEIPISDVVRITAN